MRGPLPLRAIAAVVLAGCALRAPAPPVRPTTDEALLASLERRREAVTSLRARARLRAGLQGVWTREVVLVQRPDAVRVDVLTPFGLALALGARRDRLWAYPPGEGIRYEGEATPENLTRFLGAPLEIRDVVDILLGLPPARAPLGPPSLSLTPEREYRLLLPLRDGTQTIWFSRDTHVVLRAEESRGDAPALRVAFADYRAGFPHALTVVVPGQDVAVELTYDAVEPNARIDPGLFAPPAAPRVVALEADGVPTPAQAAP